MEIHLICSNHHDILYTCGRVIKWFESLQIRSYKNYYLVSIYIDIDTKYNALSKELKMEEKLINCKIIIDIELIDKIVGGNQYFEIYFTTSNNEKYKITFDYVWSIRSSIENAYFKRNSEFQNDAQEKSSVLIIQNSKTIQDFEKQVSGTRLTENLKNYIIFDKVDTIIEVLTEEEPNLIKIK